MKTKIKLIFFMTFMLSFVSCFETHVINTVHKDGTISRKVIMKNSENEFEPELFRVPVDSTWTMETTWELSDSTVTDTILWILTATKEFAGVEDINREYKNDIGSNEDLQRSAGFSKKFRWFITSYRYSERVEKIIVTECPVSDFLNEEELNFFFLPEEVKNEQRTGSDSLRIKKLSEEVDRKTEEWLFTVLFREWTGIFYDLFGDHPDLTITKNEMLSKEKEAVRLLGEDSKEGEDESADLIPLFGEEQYNLLKSEIDSAVHVLEHRTNPYWSAESYGMEIRMPGRIIASNGYADTRSDSVNCGGILWTVQGDYFLNQPFEMWVESRINNYWTWIVTSAFVIFVLTGFIIRFSNKQKRA